MNEIPTLRKIKGYVDTSLLNDAARLRERADAIGAHQRGEPVDRWSDGEWIELEEITAFFYDRRYRARPIPRQNAESMSEDTTRGDTEYDALSAKLDRILELTTHDDTYWAIEEIGRICDSSENRLNHPTAAELQKMEAVIEAAKCIRHWHDRDGGGMVVSAEHVRKLWAALHDLEPYQSTPQNYDNQQKSW